MFDVIFDFIAGVMAWFYSLVNDYTFAIAMLTLAIMLLFTPLTLRGARSMTKMQALQPDLAHLRKQHTGDRQKLNEEMMRLYQSHGVSPLGGCLPNLVQIPIFIVLYRVIWNLRIPENNPVDNPHPRNLNTDSQLYKDLVEAGGEMPSLGMDLARSAYDVAIRTDFIEGLPYLALVAVTFLLAFLQQRQMAQRRGNAAMPNRQMEIMMKYLPFMLPVFSFFVPAALVPYFIVSSIYRMLTQAFIHATMKPPQSIAASGDDGDVIEAATVAEPEPEPGPRRSVPNQRSRRALDAEAARRAARAERRAERREDAEQAPDVTGGEPAAQDATVVRRTRATEEPVAETRRPRRWGAGATSSGRNSSNRSSASERRAAAARRNASESRGRRRGRSAPEPQPTRIQSRRTSGDGRTRNRRKR